MCICTGDEGEAMVAADSPGVVEGDSGDACGGRPGVGRACRRQGRGCAEVVRSGGRGGRGLAEVVEVAVDEVCASAGGTLGWPDS